MIKCHKVFDMIWFKIGRIYVNKFPRFCSTNVNVVICCSAYQLNYFKI